MAFTKIAAAGIASTGTLSQENVVISGVSTLGNTVVGSATTQLIVNGNARITGILTVGTSSLTFDGNTDTVRIGTGVTIQSGIVSATSYFASNSRRVISLNPGIKTLFFEATAPTGWTKLTSHDNKALRVVSGTGGGSGGSVGFTTAFTSRTPSGSVAVSNAAVTLTTTEIPAHSHPVTVSGADDNNHTGNGPTAANSDAPQNATNNTSNTGGGGSHTHNNTASFTGTAMDFAVQYVDMILCSVD